MADETQDTTSTTETQPTLPGTMPDPSAAPPPVTTSETPKIAMTDAQLKKRVEEARERNTRKLMDLLGFKDMAPEQAQEKLAELRALEDAQLSADERKERQIAELTEKAQRAEALERTIQILVDQRFNALPEQAREAIDKVANGNPEKRLEFISVLESTGAFTKGEPAPLPPASPGNGNGQSKTPPVSTSPAGGAPASTGAANKWEEYQSIQNPIHQQLFYETHRREIERDKPAD
ncbi:hypothetical protein KKA53_05180 [Candidatus Dependentiae bacterium]|nr:hypothetical protein [Candidatus Dependentiae bacterium]